jgi:hypothetical protein
MNVTVREFLAQYEDVAKDTMKRRSFETYRDIARKHLLPAFGHLKLSDLSREHVQGSTPVSGMLAYLQQGFAGYMACCPPR